MSRVTNCILSFDSGEDSARVIGEINGLFFNREMFLPIQPAGGDKEMERPTFIAAINYFKWREFLEWLPSVSWEYWDAVQLLIAEPEDDRYVEAVLQ